MSHLVSRASIPMMLLIVALAACTPGGSSPSGSSGLEFSPEASAASSVTVSAACSDAMTAAASTEDINDAMADLVAACDSLAEFVAAAAANPLALNGASPQTFAEDACASIEALKDEPLCVELGVSAS